MYVAKDVAEFRTGSIDDLECEDDTNTGSPETTSTVMAIQEPGPSSLHVGAGYKRSASNEEQETKRMNVQIYENPIDEEIEKKKIGNTYIYVHNIHIRTH